MKRWLKIVVANILVLVVAVAGLGFLALYLYDRSNFIETDDARISANTINIMATSPGKITDWSVVPGDKVSSNAIIGTEQTAGTAASSASSTAPAATGAATKPATANVDIKAPISGTIIQNIVEPGQTVAAGQPLAMIADLNKVYVVANIEETRINDVEPDQTVDITLDAFPGDTFNGKVVSITRATASTFSMIPTGTTSGSYTKVIQKIPVQISIDTAGKDILPGMSASVRIEK